MTAPDWLPAALAELDRFSEPHLSKKRATVLALVDARLAGRPEESVWNRAEYPDVCSREIFQGKWKKDPTFSSVLANVDALARGWKDGAKLRAINTAAERLALASPVAVGRVVALMSSQDEAIVLRAALGILDRAGVETAQKNDVLLTTKSYVTISPDDWDADENADLAPGA